MKINEILKLRLTGLILLTLFFANCSKNSSSNGKSRGTGWKAEKPTQTKQEAGPGLVFIEGGTFTMGRVEDDVMHDWNNTPKQQHVQSFYMDEAEVTNLMYIEYLNWLKKVFPPTDEKYVAIYTGALPDTLVWRNRLGFNESLVNNYLRHPAYSNYPVVGVNWIQAVEYSRWRTERVNENLLEKKGYLKKGAKIKDISAEKTFDTQTYLNSPSSTFGGDENIVLRRPNGKASNKKPKAAKPKEVASTTTDSTSVNKKSKTSKKDTKKEPKKEVAKTSSKKPAKTSSKKTSKTKEEKDVYVQQSSGILLPEYRLPTEVEWEYAAVAVSGQREYNSLRGQKKYPWNGSYTRSGKRKNIGDQLANFKQGQGDYGGIAGWSDDGADITNEIKKYPPNDHGLYDMAGNVAEWVADVYRPIIDSDSNDLNYFRGNIYTKNRIGEDGKINLVNLENILYDTLSNGRVIARNLPGQIEQVPIDDQETYLRDNFDRSDNVGYRDGDKESTRNFKNQKAEKKEKMYNSPEHKVFLDSFGNIVRRYDKSSKRLTLIDNKARVYKGGSWRDRAYWLDPAQRRFYPQDGATDYIGFRCAMSRVGTKAEKKRTPR